MFALGLQPSVGIWRYIENKMNLTFKGGGGAVGGAGRPHNIMAGETLNIIMNFQQPLFFDK